MVRFCALLPALAAFSEGKSPGLETVQATVQQLIDQYAVEYNVSYQVGFQNSQGSFGIAAGIDDHITGKLMTAETRIPLGSVTKAFTAAAVMKYVEEGKIELDAPVHLYVDPQLKAQNGTTLLDLWNTELINNVTVRNLLHMNSGLPDYNLPDNFNRQVYLPDQDESPIEYLWRVDKRFYCAPGECGAYSSIGFVLLGFVLSSVQGVEHWWQLDQRSFLNAEQDERWSEMLFAKKGKCNQYSNLAHQWIKGPWNQDDHAAYFYDLRENSCLNGWTMGNLASNAENVAGFFYDLLTGRIVSNSTVQQMTQFEPLNTGGLVGMSYGFGLIKSYDFSDDYTLIGHAGEDYASSAKIAGYNAKHDFSFVIMVNSEEGMNCSSPAALSHGLGASNAVSYPLLKSVVSLFTDEELSEELVAAKPWLQSTWKGDWHGQRGKKAAALAESSGVRCNYKEDYSVSWYTNGSCLAQDSWGQYYRVTNVTDSGYVITHWYDKLCTGEPAYAETFCPTCPMKDGECLAVSWQDSYPQAQSFTYYRKYGQVYHRIFKAGGVTEGCQWHRLYGNRESSTAELEFEYSLLV